MAYAKTWATSSSVKRSIAKRLALKAKQSECDRLASKVEKVVTMEGKSFRFRLGAFLACDSRVGQWFMPKTSVKPNGDVWHGYDQ